MTVGEEPLATFKTLNRIYLGLLLIFTYSKHLEHTPTYWNYGYSLREQRGSFGLLTGLNFSGLLTTAMDREHLVSRQMQRKPLKEGWLLSSFTQDLAQYDPGKSLVRGLDLPS